MMDIIIKDYTDPETGMESTSVGWKEKIGDSWFGDYTLVYPRLKSYVNDDILGAIETLEEQRNIVKKTILKETRGIPIGLDDSNHWLGMD